MAGIAGASPQREPMPGRDPGRRYPRSGAGSSVVSFQPPPRER